MAEHDDFGSFLAGFFIGGIAGAIVALLFAPQSGEETRALLREKAIELRDKSAEKFEDFSVKSQAAAKEALKKAEVMYNQAKARAAELSKKEGKVSLEEIPAETKPKKPAKPG
jgi:gas vesicle protein